MGIWNALDLEIERGFGGQRQGHAVSEAFFNGTDCAMFGIIAQKYGGTAKATPLVFGRTQGYFREVQYQCF